MDEGCTNLIVPSSSENKDGIPSSGASRQVPKGEAMCRGVFGTGNCSIQDPSARSYYSLGRDDREGILRIASLLKDDRRGNFGARVSLVPPVGMTGRGSFESLRSSRMTRAGAFFEAVQNFTFYILHSTFTIYNSTLYMQGKAFSAFHSIFKKQSAAPKRKIFQRRCLYAKKYRGGVRRLVV